MTTAPALLFPDSCALQEQWSSLEPLRPRSLWLRHLLVHEVQALVTSRRHRPLSPLQRAVLTLLEGHPLPASAGLDPTILNMVLDELRSLGLVSQAGAEAWDLLPAGRQALAEDGRTVESAERLTFHFLDRAALGLPPHHLHLHGPELFPLAPEGGPPFDPEHLKACVGADSSWKQKHHFPAEVIRVETAAPQESPEKRWRAVILDRIRRGLIFLARTAGGDDRPESLQGFALDAEYRIAAGSRPAVTLADGWQEVFPDLLHEPTLAEWEEAWQIWGRCVGLSEEVLNACRVHSPEGVLLSIGAPTTLQEGLDQAGWDLATQPIWLLCGKAETRRVVRVDLTFA